MRRHAGRGDRLAGEAEGARSLFLALDEGAQMVLRFDIGVSKADAMTH